MAVLEPIIPQQGGMQQFSYVENFIIKQKPIEVGFKKNKFSLVKRPGTDTLEEWTTEGDIVGMSKYDNKIYVWDDLGKIYRFWNSGPGFEFNKIFDNPDSYELFTENFLGTKARQKTIRIPFMSSLNATGIVATAPANGGALPHTLTTTLGIFTAESVNKYIYVPTKNGATLQSGRGQYIRIIKYNSATSVDLEFGFTIVVNPGDKIEMYDDIANTIVFNNIRKTETISGIEITTTVCVNDFDEINPEISYRSIYGDDILFFDGRVWSVNNGISISASISQMFEVTDSLTVLGDNRSKGTRNFQDSILAIEDYSKYILIFFSDSIALVWQMSYDPDSGVTLYGYNNGISGLSIFSPTSIGKKQGSLFIVNNEKQVGTINVDVVSEGGFNVSFTDQGAIMQNLFDSNIMEGDDVFIFADNTTLNVVISKVNETIIYRYYQAFEWWLPQRYPFKINTNFTRLGVENYYNSGSSLCYQNGEYDLGENIPQELSITGPQTEGNDGRMGVMQQVVLGVGFFNNPIDFNIEMDMGGDKFRMSVDSDVNGTEYIKWQNVSVGDGTVGSNILGYGNLGGENIIKENLSEMSILGFRLGLGFTGYYKMTLRNNNNSNINIHLCEFQYIVGNPYLVPLKNTF